MTIKIFNGSNWNSFAKRIRIFREGLGWTSGTKSVKVYRDTGGIPYWMVVYPEKPVALTTPIVTGTGVPGTNLELSAGVSFPTIESIWQSDDYIKPQTITYQWQRSLSSSGPWSNVGSLLTSYQPYLITSSDNNYYFRCVITATNAKDSTSINSFSLQVYDPSYTFFYGNEFGLATNGMIYFDRTNGSFPVSDTISAMGRILSYFHGFFKTYDVWYRSDSSTFRIYHRLYNAGNNRPSIPGLEYEIVFYNNSNIVDLHIINPGSTNDIYTYDNLYPAFVKDFFTRYKFYNIFNYFSGIRFRITLDASTSISASSVAPSTAISVIQASLTNNVVTLTTSVPHNIFANNPINVIGLPSVYNGAYSVLSTPTPTTITYSKTNANISAQNVSGYIAKPPSALTDGWIYIPLLDDLGVNPPDTLTFSAGSGFSSPVFDINLPYTKSNMFYPNFATGVSGTYINSTSATISWSNSTFGNSLYNANSYRVEVKRSDNNSTVFGPTITTSTSITATGLTTGVGYSITVTPNSRSDGLGQFSLTSGGSYNHAGVPNPPTNLVATVNSDTQITLTWSEPANNGSAITGYTVEYKRNVDSTWSTWATNSETDRNAVITGLTGSTLYNFRVAAVNGIGTGNWSAQVNATTNAPAVPPGAPTGLVASSPTQPTAGGLVGWTVSWTAPTNDGGAPITKYQYAVDIDASGTTYTWGGWIDVAVTNGVPNTSVNVSLFSGLQLNFKVRAVNSAGSGTESSVLTINSSPSKPGTPSPGNITNNNTNVVSSSTINWAASNVNGGTSLRYRIYRGQNTSSINTERNTSTSGESNTSFSDTISGSATTYYYRVVAENVLQSSPNVVKGISVSSDTSSALSVTQPSVNTPSLSVNNTNAGISVNWSGSAGSGTSLNYNVYRSQNTTGFSNVGSGNLRTNSAQSNTSLADTASASTTYYYRVDGTNSLSTVASAVSASITTPGPPTANTPTKNSTNSSNVNNNLAVSWGGSGSGTITYQVYRTQNTTNAPNNLVSQQTSTNYSFQYASSGKFYFRVVPSTVWGTGASSAWSVEMAVS